MGAARVERFELPIRVLETLMIPFHHTRVFFEARTGNDPVPQILQICRPPRSTWPILVPKMRFELITSDV